jgi:hypothetical protein
MSAFPEWQKFCVVQRRPDSGCIPAGYEMILRAAGATGIDFATFQDDFDLDKNRLPWQEGQNNFDSVADAVSRRYPEVRFQSRSFLVGDEKLRFVEEQIAHQRPVLVSIALNWIGQQGWHICPVVDATTAELALMWSVGPSGFPEVRPINKAEFVRVHDTFPGGREVAFLESC